MKKTLLITLIFPWVILSAQPTSQEDSILIDLWGKPKRDIIKDFLNLSPDDTASFWLVYDEYEAARKKFTEKRIEMISRYARYHYQMSDRATDRLSWKLVNNDLALEKFNRKYYRLFRKATSVSTATLFFQIENRIQSTVSAHLQEKFLLLQSLTYVPALHHALNDNFAFKRIMWRKLKSV